jgi:hypothetical protein
MGGSESGETTLVGVIEGGDAPVLASTTLEVDGKQHSQQVGDGFVLRLDDDSRMNVKAHPTSVEVLPASSRSGSWGDVASDRRASLFADVAPGDHVDVELAGWVLAPGQRIAVRGEVVEHALEGGGPRETAIERPSAITARRIAIVDSSDADASKLLDRAAQAEREKQDALRARDAAAKEAARAAAEKVTRPLAFQIKALVVLAILLIAAGIATWEGLPPAGVRLGKGAVLSLMLLATAFHTIILLLVSVIVRPPFEAPAPQASGVVKPSWDIGMMSGFFMGCGIVASGTSWVSVVFHGVNGLAGSVGYGALAGFAFLWWARHRHRRALRLARLLLSARAAPKPVASQFARSAGTVAGGQAALRHAITWHKRKYTNQSTHGPNAGQTRRWIEGTPQSSGPSSFTCQFGDTALEIHTANVEWGAPFQFMPASFVSTRASIEPGDELLVLGRPKLEDGKLHARSTGPESLLLFGAPRNARGTLLRLTLGWLLPAAALLAIIVTSIAWIVWLIAT